MEEKSLVWLVPYSITSLFIIKIDTLSKEIGNFKTGAYRYLGTSKYS
jgi:hypothetical protein